MDTTIAIQEFKDELPPRYETWRDFYFAAKGWCEQQKKEFLSDQEVMCDYMPLAHLGDISTRHIYRTTASHIKAKVFEELESELVQVNPDSFRQWHYEALRNSKFMPTDNHHDILIRWMIDFVYENKHSSNKNQP